MKKLYFVRHGQSVLNFQRTYAGRIDTPLTDMGRAQAKQAASGASSLGIDLIIASPLVRALETADIIADGIGYPRQQIIVSPIFMERSLGELEGKPWDGNPEDELLDPSIESFDMLCTRALTGLHFLQKQEAETILLVGHGSFGRAMQTVLQPENPPTKEIDNAAIVQLI